MQQLFAQAPYSIVDIRNALSDIKSDIDHVMSLIEIYERSNSFDDECRMLIALSGTEIKMTNLSADLRRKLV